MGLFYATDQSAQPEWPLWFSSGVFASIENHKYGYCSMYINPAKFQPYQLVSGPHLRQDARVLCCLGLGSLALVIAFFAVFSGELVLASLADRIQSYMNSALIQCGNALN